MAEFAVLTGTAVKFAATPPTIKEGQFILVKETNPNHLSIHYDFSDIDRQAILNLGNIVTEIINDETFLTFINNVVSEEFVSIEDFETFITNVTTALDSKIATLTSTDGSIAITGTGTGRDLAAKVSAVSGNILQKKTDGLYVSAPPAEGSVTPGDTIIDITKDGDDTKVSMNISAADKGLTKALDGLKLDIDIAIHPTTGQVQLKGKDGNLFGTGFSIPLASVLLYQGVISVPPQPEMGEYASGENFPAPPAPLAKGKYLAIVSETKDGVVASYINLTELVDIYTAGNGISIDGSNVVSLKINIEGLTFDGGQLVLDEGYYLMTDDILGKINELSEDAITDIAVVGTSLEVTDGAVNIPAADATKYGAAKLYTTLGSNEDGAVTQKVLTEALTIKYF
jgi:hypothetical protein